MTLPTITVSQLNAYIKKLIDSDLMFSSVLLTGEISNFSPHYKTGHLYFSIKDEHASVRAVMFSREASRLRFRPEDGMKIIAAGRVSVFERDGTYQLYVRELIPDGAGELAVAFEQLKKRLAAKGLFDENHKKTLPAFPHKIGIVTSPTGAALQDMLNILGRRYPICEVVLAGVNVQGTAAPQQIIHAIGELNRMHAVDLIIIGRGGGSAEDLWCFNDETLAYAIYNSRIPIISAVGHETDFTISDYVSDLRAPTPSAAAELAVPDRDELLYRTDLLYQRLRTVYKNSVDRRLQQIQLLCARSDFSNPSAFFAEDRQKLGSSIQKLLDLYGKTVIKENERAQHLKERLDARIDRIVNEQKLKLAKTTTALENLNPLSVLLRGYAIVQDNNGIKGSIRDFSTGETVEIILSDGTVQAEITATKEKDR